MSILVEIEGESGSDEPKTCHDCKDNNLSCGECPQLETCGGCKECKTEQYQPCPHCVCDCINKITCTYRLKWIQSIETANQKSLSSIDICDDCKYSRMCMTTGYCPDSKYTVYSESEKSETNIISTEDETMGKKKKTKTKKWSNGHSKVWDTGIKCVDECPHKSDGIDLWFSLDVYLKLEYLQKQFPDVEFLVYGNVEKQKDDSYILNDIIIPKQKVGGASVDDVECEGHYNTILHKHPGDTPGGFSHDDDEYINMNHDFSILIGSKDLTKVIGIGRVKTECGKWMRVPLTINVEVPAIADKFFLESVSKIEKKTYTTYNRYNSYTKEDFKHMDKRQSEVAEYYRDRFGF